MIILHIHNSRIELHTFLSIKGSRDALINMKNVSYIPITTSPQCKIESYLMEMKFYISNINDYVSCQLSCDIPDKNMLAHVSFKWNKQIKKRKQSKKKSQEKSIERIKKNMACKLLYLRFSCMHNGKIIKSLFYWYYWNNNMHGFPLSIKYGESIEPTDNQILPLNASSIY